VNFSSSQPSPVTQTLPSAGPGDTATTSRTAPRLIIAHQPTWGLDIGAVAYVQSQLIAARDAGAAVLVISDDLDEVLTLGDRVAVMHAGAMTAAKPALDWSREAIGLAMAGVANSAHISAADTICAKDTQTTLAALVKGSV
jgi:simple sugar transport system ATP-binding protein